MKLPEKHYAMSSETDRTMHTTHSAHAPERGLRMRTSTTTSVSQLLRCVSSGYLSDGCSCHSTVPAGVAEAAWAHKRERAPACEDQFFRFVWAGGEWLAYGLRNGRVRGVYCPEHCEERAARYYSPDPVGAGC